MVRDIAIYAVGYILAFIWVRSVIKKMGLWDKPFYKMSVFIISLLSWVVVIALIVVNIAKPPDEQQK